MLSKRNRLKERDFKYIYNKGRKYRGQYGMLIVVEDSNSTQFAYVVSKKVGNAVQRHRMTRLLREITKKRLKEDIKDVKCIYVAFIYCNNYEKLSEELNSHFDNTIRDIKKN